MIQRVFVVERPLQILISLSILNQLNSNSENFLLVADCFHDAKGVCERLIAQLGSKVKVKYFPNYKNAINHCRKINCTELFLHWDVGFGTNIRIMKLLIMSYGKINLNVYEEGIGTYRDDIYPIWKKRIFRFFGLPVNNGGNRFSKKIYVFNPQDYLSNVTRPAPIIKEIKTTLPEILDRYRKELYAVFNVGELTDHVPTTEREKCIIYMSNWSFKLDDISCFKGYEGFKVLKLHPHIKERYRSVGNGFWVAPNSMPAEILISSLSDIFKKVEVYHCGSSVSRYMYKENVEYKKISAKHL